MTRVCVEFEVELPDNLTEAQIREWLHYELGESPCMKASNPLCATELEARHVRFAKEKAGGR